MSRREFKFIRAHNERALAPLIEKEAAVGWEFGLYTVAIDATQPLLMRELWTAVMHRYNYESSDINETME